MLRRSKGRDNPKSPRPEKAEALPVSVQKLPVAYESWSREERMDWCGELLDSLQGDNKD